MKQVIDSKQSQTVDVTKINPTKYFGVKHPIAGSRGFIMRRGYGEGKDFTLVISYEMTLGNGWIDHDDTDLVKMIRTLINDAWRVYEFDTFIELMTWVSNGK